MNHLLIIQPIRRAIQWITVRRIKSIILMNNLDVCILVEKSIVLLCTNPTLNESLINCAEDNDMNEMICR